MLHAPTRLRRSVAHRLAIALGAIALAATLVAPAASASTAPVASGADRAVALTATSVVKPWYSIEQYYLGLVNCTRTGGWVQPNGTCSGYGSGTYSAYVPPLSLSAGISDRVSRPYAKLLAMKNLCTHNADGDPGYRLRRGGFTRYTWGENIGCSTGYTSEKAAVLSFHLRMQAEEAVNGGHWKNMKNASYRWIGIGVWQYGLRTRLVTDFYG